VRAKPGQQKKPECLGGTPGGTRNRDTGNWRLALEVFPTDQTEAHER
jgi:hypothetical protein